MMKRMRPTFNMPNLISLPALLMSKEYNCMLKLKMKFSCCAHNFDSIFVPVSIFTRLFYFLDKIRVEFITGLER